MGLVEGALLFLLLIIWLLLICISDFVLIPYYQERTILARMYLNDGGASWTRSLGWLGTGDHCSWEGITCSASLQVEALAVQENALSGFVYETLLMFLECFIAFSSMSNSTSSVKYR